MGKIPIQDLARMMGIPHQDLLFKLKSIGVRVDGDDAQIDTDTLQAILQGRSLPHPREVILRDGETGATTVHGRTLGRRPPTNPLRPGRPRNIVNKAEPRIKTLPVAERPKPAPVKAHPPKEETPQETPAATQPSVGVEAATSPTREASPAAAEQPAKQQLDTSGAKPAEAAPRPVEKKVRSLKRATVSKDPVSRPSHTGPMRPSRATSRAAAASNRKRRRGDRRREPAAPQPVKKLEFKDAAPEGTVMIAEGMTVREFAEKLGVKSKDLIKALFRHGVMANINNVLSADLAEKLAEELGVETMVVSFEEEVQLSQEISLDEEGSPGTETRAPVVTIMGHVDHGKTSLLDAIRSSRVTESEFGGITQHIGAYEVDIEGRKIVFLDTPGHEAFTTMRARGTKVTDIVVLVVAADDGVMPQTIEAINHARAANVPIIVAINKIDKDNANPDRVKKDLADQNLLVEDWGGDTVSVSLSALKKEGISELLEMILLNAELLELKANPKVQAQGVVLEARKEIGRGIVATVLVQDGTLRVGDTFVTGQTWGKVRSMSNDLGERTREAGPSTPVEVNGFNDVPAAGDPLQVLEDESKARSIAGFRSNEQRSRSLSGISSKLSLDQLFSQIEAGEVKELPVVLKGDVQGSVEVLKDALGKLATDKVKVRIIGSGIGGISTNDVLLASASNAIVIGFNVRPERNAADLAEKEEIDIRLHTVIYELLDELKKAMAGLLEPTFREVELGRAEIRETFKVPKIGTIAGSHVVEGLIRRNSLARLLRDNVVVYEGKITSLRRFKDDASEVRNGFDCGIALERFQDVKPGDVIEAYAREEVAATL